MDRFLRRVRFWLRHRQIEAELTEELELHRAMKQDALERSGVPAAEAATASRRALGNVTLAREDARGVWIWPAIEHVARDVRFGARLLRASPSFSVIAILTLAVGIGASTAVFSVVEAELLRPLPFPHADRLVSVRVTNVQRPADFILASVPDFLDWRSQARAFDELAAYRWNDRHILASRSGPEPVIATAVTANFFSMLEMLPVQGRPFRPDEDHGGRNHVVILSDACWQRDFNADPHLVGGVIMLDGEPYEVAGITAPGLRLEFNPVPDLFIPLALDSGDVVDRQKHVLNVVGRLAPHVTFIAATADVRTIADDLAKQYPADDGGRTARVEDLRSSTGFEWRTVLFFFGAAMSLLLVSCVNVGSLSLARALARDREFALRAALGGGRGAIIRQLLVEGVLVALPAGGLGLLLAAWGTTAFSVLIGADFLSRGGHVELDARVCAFALVVSSLTALVFGLAPALIACRVNLNATLAHGTRSVGGHAGARHAQSALVVAEVALALVLLFGAGLFTNSFVRLTHMPLGFDPTDRLTMRLLLKGPLYVDPRQVVLFYQRLVARVGATAGVRAAVAASAIPLNGSSSISFVVAGRPRPAPGEEPSSILRIVMPGYFQTLGIHLQAGRDFAGGDVEGAPRVAVINARLAQRFFVDESPIGRSLLLVPEETSTTPAKAGAVQIVGVVENSKEVGMNEVAFDDIYLPFVQNPSPSMFLIVSAATPTASLADTIRREVLELDKDLPVYSISTLQQRFVDSLRGDRFNLGLIGVFAALALALASAGVYGAMSYAIEQRTREFGVRLALGAQRARILALALRYSAALGLAGLGIGVAVSLILARLLGTSLYLVRGKHDGMLYGVTLTDPLTLVLVCTLLFSTSLLAAYLPARRAANVDPMNALRQP